MRSCAVICVRPAVNMGMLGALLTLLLLQCDFTNGADPIYLVAVTSQAVSGGRETLCAHVHEPNKTLSLAVTLSSDKGNLTILKQASIKKDFYKCVTFQVPIVSTDYVATVYVEIQGENMVLYKTTKILIKPPKAQIFIQTDKPIYKPGEKIKFRIVSLGPNFLTYNQKFKTVVLQDPKANRIGQWLNQTTRSGILDLSHPTTPHAIQGYYTIIAWDEKDQQNSQYFEMKEYVLPKFEVTVNLPPIITTMDKEITLKICARYTYGKSVQGSVTAEVCRTGYYWYYGYSNTCKNYNITLDKTGCGSQVINVTDYSINQWGNFQVKAKVEEDGTGIIIEETATVPYTTDYVMISFVDAPQIYRPGISYEGKVLVSDVHHKPMKDQTVYLIANHRSTNINITLTTDSNGKANFSLNTSEWAEESISLQARHKEDKNQYWPSSRYYYPGYLWLNPFYSKSKSFLKLITASDPLSCASDAVVEAGYIIPGNALKKGQKTLDFFYIVSSKGSMAQSGRVSVNVDPLIENKGKVTFTLKKTSALPPFAQVVVYTILPNGETVADSLDFPIEQCLPNKVSLNFSSSTALPKEKVTLNLEAQPGSLCSVRSIDQSVLLLKPEAELNAAYVFGMLQVQMLKWYPYQVEEYDNFPCIKRKIKLVEELGDDPVPVFNQPREKRSIYYPNYPNDAYSAFKATGVKIATNSEVKKPVYCYEYETFETVRVDSRVVLQPELESSRIVQPNRVEPPIQNTIRRSFPETWIWDLVPVGKSGSATLTKTVPDTITKWATGAFCTSSVGFGVAPSTNLTAVLPFFVSLTLPYSVIRGETFTLKASVFNYLSKCIMVKVTLGSSKQFTALPCNGCNYTQCICSEESKTFQWTVTPSEVGQVTVTVKAETVQTQERCGGEEVTVPEGRRIDTVVQSFLVEAEGTKRTITHNELLCLTDSQVNKTVLLTLPEVFVKGSATSFVTVLGDLMGSALKNIENLLQMPSGCGEQNIAGLAPNIYVIQYLESTGQLTPEILARAKTFMETGYQRQLGYKRNDGSYSISGNWNPSGNTWLTAFVMKIFGGAKKYVFIDQTHIDQAKNWLGQQQQASGCYKTVGTLSNNMMKGGVSDDVTLTAYITAALLELGINKSDPMVEKGLVCLKNSSSNLNNTYFTALLSYTFTLADDQEMRQNLITILDRRAKREGVGRYWTRENNGGITGSLEVEMSAYVMLALHFGPTLPAFGLNYSATIVHWLTKQQNAYGGFSSTQDTVVALQALAKYSAATYSPEGSVAVSVTSPSKQKYRFTVNQKNRLLYQEKQLQPPNGTFTLGAQGKGCVFVQFALHCNVPPPADSSAFSIVANTTRVCYGSQYSVVTLDFTVRYKGPRDETNMMIIDVKLLSGFVLDYMSLQSLKGDTRVKILEQEKGHLILYLDGMKKKEKQNFSLKLWQNVEVKDLKPALVTVFDYYKTSEGAVKEYTASCA